MNEPQMAMTAPISAAAPKKPESPKAEATGTAETPSQPVSAVMTTNAVKSLGEKDGSSVAANYKIEPELPEKSARKSFEKGTRPKGKFSRKGKAAVELEQAENKVKMDKILRELDDIKTAQATFEEGTGKTALEMLKDQFTDADAVNMLEVELYDGVVGTDEGVKEGECDEEHPEENSDKAGQHTSGGRRHSENLKQTLKTIETMVQRLMKERQQMQKAYSYYDAAEVQIMKEVEAYRRMIDYAGWIAPEQMPAWEWKQCFEKYFVLKDFTPEKPPEKDTNAENFAPD